MSLLDVDRYVRLRLTDQLKYYASKTATLDKKARAWQMAAIVIGALGTLLAALGPATVPWVALTSALASAAMAYLGHKQFETTLTSYNQTATDLQNLQAWWAALLPDEQALAENVDKLVDTTEKVLGDEQDAWAQNMTDALEALRLQQTKDQPPAKAGADKAAGPLDPETPDTLPAAGGPDASPDAPADPSVEPTPRPGDAG